MRRVRVLGVGSDDKPLLQHRRLPRDAGAESAGGRQQRGDGKKFPQPPVIPSSVPRPYSANRSRAGWAQELRVAPRDDERDLALHLRVAVLRYEVRKVAARDALVQLGEIGRAHV